MYWLISSNHPYLDELNRNPDSTSYQKAYEAMEIDLKNKFKVNERDIKEWNNLDQSSDENSLALEEEDTVNNEEKATPGVSNILQGAPLEVPGSQGKASAPNPRIVTFKKYIRVADILSSIIIIIGCILAQQENDLYFASNIKSRVCATVIINYVNSNPGNNSWERIFSEDTVNLTSLIEVDGVSLPVNSMNFALNVQEMDRLYGDEKIITDYRKFIYGFLSPIRNTDILHVYNITPEMFNYAENESDYNNILVPLEIDAENESLRLIILYTTIIGGLLMMLSRYLDHVRETTYKKDLEIPFYKGESCLYLLLEEILILVIPYPGLNSYSLFSQLGVVICLPFSSIFATVSIYRLFFFILKFFKSVTIWNSQLAEKKCEKYACKADSRFAFKSFQKNNPFCTLFIIFILACVCFGYSLRVYEQHFWETQKEINQNWNYIWNAMWCVFVSMTTVGYGDFYPKTIPGRIIIIVACIVGVYFSSMMLVFMTQKSILADSEQKAYRLITRLKLRAQIKDVHSNMIWHFLKMVHVKHMNDNKLVSDKNFQITFRYEKRCVISLIDQKKVKDRSLKSFDIIPTKELLFDLSERIESDIRDIKKEIDSMQMINNSIIGYTDSQVNMMRSLKKNVIATKFMYDIIEKKPSMFGALSNYEKAILFEEFGKTYYNRSSLANFVSKKRKSKRLSRFSTIKRPSKVLSADIFAEKRHQSIKTVTLATNPQADDSYFNPSNNRFHVKETDTEGENEDCYYAEEMAKYQVTPEEFKNHFAALFFTNCDAGRKSQYKTPKTLRTIKGMREENKKLCTMRLLKRKTPGISSDNSPNY